MPVLVVGINHRSAPVELLERLAFDREELGKALDAARASQHVHEAVILSTCNRVEVYASVDGYHAGLAALKGFLSTYHHVPLDAFGDRAYGLYEDEGVRHLFRVAAGTESMVIGEPQILSQVRRAFADADAEGAVGWLLSALFRRAIAAGRRVRAETGIERSGAGLADAGTALARRSLGDLAGRTVLIVGAGTMSDLATAHLADGGARVLIANRTEDRARALADRVGGEAVSLSALEPAIARADLILASTGSHHPLVSAGAVARAIGARPDRPLVVIDLAVPRDVEPEVADIPGVTLHDLDDLRDSLTPDRALLHEVERARAIVADEVPRFFAWRRAHRLAPVIGALKLRGEDVRAAELARASRALADLTEDERDAVDALTRATVAKLLHDPIAALKEHAGSPEGDALERALRVLWSIDVEGER